MMVSSTDAAPSARTTFCCTAQPSRTCATSERRTVVGADLLIGRLVERVDRGRVGVGADDELLVAHLGVARGQRQALRVDGVHHVVRRDAVARAARPDRDRP